MSEDGGMEHNNTFVWGTNLVIDVIQGRIQKFMRCFVQEGSSEALYTTLIKQVGTPTSHTAPWSCHKAACSSRVRSPTPVNTFHKIPAGPG